MSRFGVVHMVERRGAQPRERHRKRRNRLLLRVPLITHGHGESFRCEYIRPTVRRAQASTVEDDVPTVARAFDVYHVVKLWCGTIRAHSGPDALARRLPARIRL